MKQFLALAMILMICALPADASNKAPNFTLDKISKGKFNLENELKNGPVLIDFWATWCKPCKKALPLIEEINKKYSEMGLQVVTISMDSPRSQAKIKPFIKGKKYTFEVLLDPNGKIRQLFGGKEIPFSVLIDKDSNIVFQHLGYKPGDEVELEAKVRELLGLEAENPLKETSEESNEDNEK